MRTDTLLTVDGVWASYDWSVIETWQFDWLISIEPIQRGAVAVQSQCNINTAAPDQAYPWERRLGRQGDWEEGYWRCISVHRHPTLAWVTPQETLPQSSHSWNNPRILSRTFCRRSTDTHRHTYIHSHRHNSAYSNYWTRWIRSNDSVTQKGSKYKYVFR